MDIDINNPKDGNKIVSPDNLHTDPFPGRFDDQPADEPEKEPEKVEKPEETNNKKK